MPGVHVVLLGDSTLDNGRYLCSAKGELSVTSQLAQRCEDRGWKLTALAQDGSVLEDVRTAQLPNIPDGATHVVVSASGNDLLMLLNEMVAARWSLRSMYSALGDGLSKVVERYHGILHGLKRRGIHVACCTVYRPNFAHLFFRSLAALSLGLHNARIRRMAAELGLCVIDLAVLFDGGEDFANPLELSTQGGAKVVENITRFVSDHQGAASQRGPRAPFGKPGRGLPSQLFVTSPLDPLAEDDACILVTEEVTTQVCAPMTCCQTHGHKVYASKHLETLPSISKAATKAMDEGFAGAEGLGLGEDPQAFSLAQRPWRET